MTEKRFQWVYIKDNTLELRDNGIVKVFNNERLEELLNELSDENEQLRQQLQRIYDIATVNKVKNIVEEIYDDLLYETSEESDYARKKVLKCLEKIDDFGDDLE